MPRGPIALRVLAALVGVTLVTASHAQEPEPAAPLTAGVVEGFVASYPKVKAKAAELRQEYDVSEETSEVRAWHAWARVGGARDQLDGVVRDHGFDDFNAWIKAFSLVGQAYGFAQDDGDLDDKLTETLERLEKDPNLADWQKEMIKQQLLHSAEAVAAMRPPQENIDAVKPYVEQLDGIFEEKDG